MIGVILKWNIVHINSAKYAKICVYSEIWMLTNSQPDKLSKQAIHFYEATNVYDKQSIIIINWLNKFWKTFNIFYGYHYNNIWIFIGYYETKSRISCNHPQYVWY